MTYAKANHLDSVRYEIRGKIARKSYELRLLGVNILELNIGNPGAFDFRVPDNMNMAIIRNLDTAAAYSDSKGIFAAREAIVIDTQNQGIKNVDIEQVFIGNGVSELIMMSMEALLNPEDEILIPSPDYPLWTAAATIANGKPRHYNCDASNNWQPDLEHIESLINEKTKGLVVINPNNPTGVIYSEETLQGIIALARKYKLIIFADEIYNRVLFDGNKHIPMATLADDVLIITYNGLSKNYRACGYRSGWMYITGPVSEASSYIEGLTLIASMRLCSNVPGQLAIQTALGGYQSIFDLCAADGRLSKQRDLAFERLNAIEGITCVKSNASMYLFPEIDLQIYNFNNSEEFVYKFLEEKHVLFVHGSGFNYDRSDSFRVVFLPHVEVLSEAFDRLEVFLKKNRR